ncbi:hypothetical protein QM012_009071 [Aureobasidium pullulans]|uniref:CCHC-type domain-containing protein n=1 Tax=Aureobasidium pullulans TaxID=5580 RepID=A0ABR0TK20_AURPU
MSSPDESCCAIGTIWQVKSHGKSAAASDLRMVGASLPMAFCSTLGVVTTAQELVVLWSGAQVVSGITVNGGNITINENHYHGGGPNRNKKKKPDNSRVSDKGAVQKTLDTSSNVEGDNKKKKKRTRKRKAKAKGNGNGKGEGESEPEPEPTPEVKGKAKGKKKSSGLKCNKCHKPGHFARDCKACAICDEWGHIAQNCPTTAMDPEEAKIGSDNEQKKDEEEKDSPLAQALDKINEELPVREKSPWRE